VLIFAICESPRVCILSFTTLCKITGVYYLSQELSHHSLQTKNHADLIFQKCFNLFSIFGAFLKITHQKCTFSREAKNSWFGDIQFCAQKCALNGIWSPFYIFGLLA
jgi:hypothetical protein